MRTSPLAHPAARRAAAVRLGLRRLATTAGVAVLAAATVAPAAGHAAPIDDQRAQAAQLAQQLSDSQARDDALNEQMNGANLKLNSLQQQIVTIQARLESAQAQMTQLKGLIQERARSLYRSSGQSTGINIFDLHSFTDIAAARKYGDLTANRDHQLLSGLHAAQVQLASDQTQAQRDEASAQQPRDAIVATKAQLEANAAHVQQLLTQTNGQIAVLVAQEQQQQLQASQAAAQVRLNSPAGRSNRGPSGPPPAVQPGAGGAVAFAMAQVGKPYEYAASGPDSYDCSGLTMASWGAAGVSLPHYSGAQYDDFPHVAMNQLQPGDLVFGSDPGQHVALYAGGGMVVEATHTGDVIHYWPMRSEFVLAARP